MIDIILIIIFTFNFSISLIYFIWTSFDNYYYLEQQNLYTKFDRKNLSCIFYCSGIIYFFLFKLFRSSFKLDPLRTVLEIEIFNICFDTIDFTQLFKYSAYCKESPKWIMTLIKIVICYWILTLFLRITNFYLIYLPFDSKIFWNNKIIQKIFKINMTKIIAT